jgi:hypothetical protein
MTPLERRVTNLENREGAKDLTFTGNVVLDDTRENVEARLAEIKASGERVITRIIVPHKGESVNEWRRAEGLDPLSIPGWDDPCEH